MAHEMTTRAVFRAQMMSLIVEYIDEAEHQEGDTYLKDFFEDDKQIYQDFILYLQSKYRLED